MTAGERVVRDICDAGGEAIYVRADVGDEASVTALVEQAVSHFGALHILVNNAAKTDLDPERAARSSRST